MPSLALVLTLLTQVKKVKGVELDSMLALSENLMLRVSAMSLDAVYDSFEKAHVIQLALPNLNISAQLANLMLIYRT